MYQILNLYFDSSILNKFLRVFFLIFDLGVYWPAES